MDRRSYERSVAGWFAYGAKDAWRYYSVRDWLESPHGLLGILGRRWIWRRSFSYFHRWCILDEIFNKLKEDELTKRKNQLLVAALEQQLLSATTARFMALLILSLSNPPAIMIAFQNWLKPIGNHPPRLIPLSIRGLLTDRV